MFSNVLNRAQCKFCLKKAPACTDPRIRMGLAISHTGEELGCGVAERLGATYEAVSSSSPLTSILIAVMQEEGDSAGCRSPSGHGYKRPDYCRSGSSDGRSDVGLISTN